MADLSKQSDDQLEAAAVKLMAQKDEVREKLLAIREEQSVRAAAARAELAEGGVVIVDGVPAAAGTGGGS